MYERLKFDKIAKTFYDGLDEGVFKGLKCSECGSIEFPPSYIVKPKSIGFSDFSLNSCLYNQS